eukprot:m.1141567 g.1141567  ORF g.1141567 m.1141567 type:complete len:126 (-) comp24449_c0_seq29:2799-3176(-)
MFIMSYSLHPPTHTNIIRRSLEIDVVVPEDVIDALRGLAGHLKMFKEVDEAAECIKEVLQCDPRSVYRKNKCADELYPLCLDALHILTRFDGHTATVVSVQLLSDTAYADTPLNVNNLSLADEAD